MPFSISCIAAPPARSCAPGDATATASTHPTTNAHADPRITGRISLILLLESRP
jgi:hypothetical protein